MKNTVVIFNAGIGALTMAFRNAGYNVLKAFEPDKRYAEIYKQNLDENLTVCDYSFVRPEMIPDCDVCVLSLTQLKDIDEKVQKLFQLIQEKHPPVVALITKQKIYAEDIVRENINALMKQRYRIKYKNIKSQEVTGFPLREEFTYVVAERVMDRDDAMDLMPDKAEMVQTPLDIWMETEKVDSWYYKINAADIALADPKEGELLSWNKKQKIYQKCEDIYLDLRKYPLIRVFGRYRRITHREIARMKGFPANFPLLTKNKSEMYKALAYAPNVKVTEIIAENISGKLQGSSFSTEERKPENAERFERLFVRYLNEKCENVHRSEDTCEGTAWSCDIQGEKWFFEVKMYSDAAQIATLNRLQAYMRLYNLHAGKNAAANIPERRTDFNTRKIYVIANVVLDEIREQYIKEGIGAVWDIRNILWLFEEYPELKSELISILNYSVETIEPEKPEPFLFPERRIFEELPRREAVAEDYTEQLGKLGTGVDFFTQYEKLCVSILKYTLGEYLTLWQQQRTTDEGLHRFDLCCKIKNGVTQDFFDTVCRYFATKYIVFEFKNHAGSITQHEIYTTEKYLYEKALRKVAIIISREGPNENALKAARGSLRESGKLIICLSDKDLINMIEIKKEDQKSTGEYLERILDDMLIHLEK